MSTGGIALPLAVSSHQFPRLVTTGSVLQIMDLSFFVFLCIGMKIVFLLAPATLEPSLVHPNMTCVLSSFLLAVSQCFFLFWAKELTVHSMTPV